MVIKCHLNFKLSSLHANAWAKTSTDFVHYVTHFFISTTLRSAYHHAPRQFTDSDRLHDLLCGCVNDGNIV